MYFTYFNYIKNMQPFFQINIFDTSDVRLVLLFVWISLITFCLCIFFYYNNDISAKCVGMSRSIFFVVKKLSNVLHWKKKLTLVFKIYVQFLLVNYVATWPIFRSQRKLCHSDAFIIKTYFIKKHKYTKNEKLILLSINARCMQC